MDNNSKTGLISLVNGGSGTSETAVYAIELGFEFGNLYVHAIVEPTVLSSKNSTEEQKAYIIKCAEETLEEGGGGKSHSPRHGTGSVRNGNGTIHPCRQGRYNA